MDGFPEFMKQACEQIAKNNQATPGVEGYVFDGVEGSQMAFWTSGETATSEARSHEFDEYMLVMQGCYPLIVNGSRIPVKAGEEYFISKSVMHSGEVLGGTRNDPCIWRPSRRSPSRLVNRSLAAGRRPLCAVLQTACTRSPTFLSVVVGAESPQWLNPRYARAAL